jgi:tRNA(fMet)-specific endonuclease VapC
VTSFVLDTDHLSLLQRSHPAVIQRLLALPAAEIAITIVTAEEQLRGWLAAIRQHHTSDRQLWAYRGLRDALASFTHFTILDFDQSAYERFTTLRQSHPRLGTQDLRIAAITSSIGATLVTRNHRDFSQLPNLTLADWTIPAASP